MRFFTTLLVLALAVPAFGQVTKQERAGIVNFSKVDAVVACGGATDTSALDGLTKPMASRPSSTCAPQANRAPTSSRMRHGRRNWA